MHKVFRSGPFGCSALMILLLGTLGACSDSKTTGSPILQGGGGGESGGAKGGNSGSIGNGGSADSSAGHAGSGGAAGKGGSQAGGGSTGNGGSGDGGAGQTGSGGAAGKGGGQAGGGSGSPDAPTAVGGGGVDGGSVAATGGAAGAEAVCAVLGTVDAGTPPKPACDPSKTYQYRYQNPCFDAEARISDIISRLSTANKIALLRGPGRVPGLNIPYPGQAEGMHGAAWGGPANWGDTPTTTFPQAYGLAETWDPEMVRKVAEVEGTEFRYLYHAMRRGGLVVRAPNADLGRDPRWGRTEECYGEDPHLVATMVKAFVHGLQGDHPHYLRTASLMKHFLANTNENGRGTTSSTFDDRDFREYHAFGFHAGFVEARAASFMTAYNKYNNIPCHAHPVVRNILMKEWGVDGVISTDGGGIRVMINEQRSYPDLKSAVAAAIKAGTGWFLDTTEPGVSEALADGTLKESDLDDVLRNNFRIMIRLGMYDPQSAVPYTNVGTVQPWTTDANKNLARLVTNKSIVLLKNANNTLPLKASDIKRMAVVGPRANEVLFDWYSGTPPYSVTVVDGLKNKLGAAATVTYARDNTDEAAVNAAKAADVVVVAVGNHPWGNSPWARVQFPSEGREAVDRRSISMEPTDENLIKAVYAANPKTVVLLVASFPYVMTWVKENIPAVVHMTHCSQEMGNAFADVLFGDYNPAGRLTQTWPQSMADLPAMLNYNVREGRTYMYSTKTPQYPFGYGLSYSTFEYSNLKTSSPTMSGACPIYVSVDVKNTGTRAGEEVVQMYIKHMSTAVAQRPIKALKGFKRVAIQPGATVTVTMVLTTQDSAYWDIPKTSWVVEKEDVQILVGPSSADADLKLSTKISVAP